jgi:DNA-binding Lrp family transcriptional regulator
LFPEALFREALDELDRLTAGGALTGYTVEPRPRYLEGGLPALAYGAYEGERAERRHLAAVVDLLAAAGGRVAVHRRSGTVCSEHGLKRSRELMAVARFASEKELEQALAWVSNPSFCGRWRYPDLRVCGAAGPGLVDAHAHSLVTADSAAVVLSLPATPPLAGMTSRRVRLLPAWLAYLGDASHLTSRMESGYR